jgi:ATP-dependent Lon protease
VIEVVKGGSEAVDESGAIQHLPELLPVLPLREMVAFPNTLTPLAVGQERSVHLVNDALSRDRMLVLVASKDPEIEEPGPEDLYRVGVAGTIARMLKMPDGTMRILVQSGPRVRIEDFLAREPYLTARIHEEPDVIELSSELEALTRHIQTTFSSIIEQVPYLPEELQIAVANLEDPEALGHMIAGSLRIKTEEKQELLEERNVTNRLRKLSSILAREVEVMELGSKIQSEVQSEMDKTSCAARWTRPSCPKTSTRRPSGSSPGSSACRRRRPNTA